MSSFKALVILLSTLFFMSGLLGCEQKGPAERAGEKVDKSVEKTEDKIKDTADRMKKD
jgi:hypothetical protein